MDHETQDVVVGCGQAQALVDRVQSRRLSLAQRLQRVARGAHLHAVAQVELEHGPRAVGSQPWERPEPGKRQ